MLVSVNDQVACFFGSQGDKSLAYGQGRAAVGKSYLDDRPGVLVQDQISKDIRVRLRKRDGFEVEVRREALT